MLWTMPSAALRSCFLSHINDTRLSMDKFQQALAGVFVRGSFPPVGTNPRLPVLPALLDFSMHIFRKRLILYSDTKSAAFI